MERFFEAQRKRKTVKLDGEWDFKIDPDDMGVNAGWFESFPAADRMEVPACWNQTLKYDSYFGVAWYHRTFLLENASNLWFEFGAVSGESRVWLDGKPLTAHYGSFTAFYGFAADVGPGLHHLTLRVDASSDDETIPLPRVDWYHYGGITRSVSLAEVGDCAIRYCHAEYTLDLSRQSASVRFRISAFSERAVELPVRVSLGDCQVEEVHKFEGETVIETAEIKLKNVVCWSPQQPVLYDLYAQIGEDDFCDRVGFREVCTAGGKVQLNGKALTLRGINRHEMHPDWGFTLPRELMKHDLAILQDLGCNMVRGSHYPNAPAFLDLCDREGMLFWSEIPLWGYPERNLASEKLVARAEGMFREMVEQYYNHPSIIFWGLHNEIDTASDAGVQLTERLAALARKLDSSRLITFATDRILTDRCLAFADVISINKYHGWYEGGVDRWQGFLDAVRQKLEADGVADRPVVMSEFGAAALYGCHDFRKQKWTEEYQAELIQFTLKLFHETDFLSGTFIWQFTDIRTAPEMGNDRARGFNNKGILNEYRKPKLAYYAARDIYHELARREL